MSEGGVRAMCVFLPGSEVRLWDDAHPSWVELSLPARLTPRRGVCDERLLADVPELPGSGRLHLVLTGASVGGGVWLAFVGGDWPGPERLYLEGQAWPRCRDWVTVVDPSAGRVLVRVRRWDGLVVGVEAEAK